VFDFNPARSTSWESCSVMNVFEIKSILVQGRRLMNPQIAGADAISISIIAPDSTVGTTVADEMNYSTGGAKY
jgi:hypothetical protein